MSVAHRSPAAVGSSPTTLAADLDAAAAAWTVFSTAYGRLPEPGFVDALRSAEQLAGWPYDDRESRSGIRLLVGSGDRAGRGEADEQLPALVLDHRRLFVGPRPLLAAPWESVHRSREGLVFDVHTLEVRQVYRRFGLQTPALNKEPDDHVALEATFVSALAVRALDALAAGDTGGAGELVTAIGDFTREHLQQWVPDFLERVEEHASTDYHRGMSRLTAGALDHLLALPP